MKKAGKILSLSIIAVLGFYACSTQISPTTSKSEIKTIKPEKTGKVLVGKAVFPVSRREASFKTKSFKAKAVSSDISTTATISVIGVFDNKTIATGVTDSLGNFQIDMSKITLTNNVIYILEASKRTFQDVETIRTYIKWNGTAWDSITVGDALINENTTAITIISGYTGISPSNVIGKIDPANLADIYDATNTNVIVTQTDITNVSSLVNSVLLGERDPIALIKYDASKSYKYYVDQVYNYNSIATKNGCVGCSFLGATLSQSGVRFYEKDFSYADLSGQDLSNADLSRTILVGADLRGTKLPQDLSYLDLSNTNLSNQDLTQSDLTGAILTNANLTGANLNGADLTKTKVSGVIFKDANLSNTNFKKVNLFDANFENTEIQNADFTSADLTGANWSKLKTKDLSNVKIEKANLTGASLSGVNLSSTSLSLKGTRLINVDFTKADLTNRVFSFVNLSDCIFSEANLTNTDFSYSNISKTNFSNATLQSTKLNNVTVVDSNFNKAIFINTNFSNSSFSFSDFSEADFKDSIFDGDTFEKCYFNNSIFPNSSLNATGVTFFSNTAFLNVNFSNKEFAKYKFKNSNFTGANFAGSNLEWVEFAGGNKLSSTNFLSASSIKSVSYSNEDLSGLSFSGDASFSSFFFSAPLLSSLTLSGLKCENCTFSGNLSNISASNINCKGCNLFNIVKSENIDFSGGIFTKSIFGFSVFKNFNFNGAVFQDISRDPFGSVDFTGATWNIGGKCLDNTSAFDVFNNDYIVPVSTIQGKLVFAPETSNTCTTAFGKVSGEAPCGFIASGTQSIGNIDKYYFDPGTFKLKYSYTHIDVDKTKTPCYKITTQSGEL